MKRPDFKFWATLAIPLIGAALTWLTMYFDLKEEVSKSKVEIQFMKEDISEIKGLLFRIENKVSTAKEGKREREVI